jgi:excisionase family DNA binding protein
VIPDALGGRLFAGVPEIAELLESDERTVRRAIAAGEIPATRVGVKYMIPVSWLRQRAGTDLAAPAASGPDLDQLADRVADRLFARFARMLAGGLAPDTTAAGSVGAEPAAISAPPPYEDTPDGQPTAGPRR